MALLPEGNYTGEIIEQGFAKSQNNNSMFIVRVRVASTPPCERTLYFAITDKTVERLIQTLGNMGYDLKAHGFGPLDSKNPDHISLVGTELHLGGKHETDDKGVLREKWYVNRPGPEYIPLVDSEIERLDRMLGNSGPILTITDDDIPF